jgi:hypothetical protein
MLKATRSLVLATMFVDDTVYEPRVYITTFATALLVIHFLGLFELFQLSLEMTHLDAQAT